MHEHEIVRNAELRKFRREQLLQRQNLEKVLLTEVRRLKDSFCVKGTLYMAKVTQNATSELL